MGLTSRHIIRVQLPYGCCLSKEVPQHCRETRRRTNRVGRTVRLLSYVLERSTARLAGKRDAVKIHLGRTGRRNTYHTNLILSYVAGIDTRTKYPNFFLPGDCWLREVSTAGFTRKRDTALLNNHVPGIVRRTYRSVTRAGILVSETTTPGRKNYHVYRAYRNMIRRARVLPQK